MRLERKELAGRSTQIEGQRARIAAFSPSDDGQVPDCLQLLNGGPEWDWNRVKTILAREPSRLDPLLFKLHFRRRDRLDDASRNRLLEFLAAAYQISRDVRYFNEFLWFYDRGGPQSLWLLTLDNFFGNLDPGNRHYFPICSRSDAEAFLQRSLERTSAAATLEMDTALRVGLMGSPTHFPEVIAALREDGFSADCYFVPYHPHKAINAVLRNRAAHFALRLLKKAMFEHSRLDFDYRSPEIEEILRKEGLDIGFHKLGFIIKPNIISAFKLGLLNDHWALLPFIRGMSSIEWSVLLGVPLAATSHLVSEAVDAGDIIAVFPYRDATTSCSTIAEIRSVIRRDRDRRAIESLRQFARCKSAVVKNDTTLGQTFYSIHPLLCRYIDARILQKPSVRESGTSQGIS